VNQNLLWYQDILLYCTHGMDLDQEDPIVYQAIEYMEVMDCTEDMEVIEMDLDPMDLDPMDLDLDLDLDLDAMDPIVVAAAVAAVAAAAANIRHW